MAPKKVIQDREEALKRKREAEKLRRDRIRNDPILKKAEQEKEHARYLRKLEKGTVKPVEDLTPEEHETMKEKWRVSSNKHYSKITQKPDVPPRQEHIETLAKRKRIDSKYLKKNIELQNKIKALERKNEKLRKREQRLKKKISKKDSVDDYLSPGTRTTNIMKRGDQEIIARKVLFAETVYENLRDGYKELKREYDKRVVKRLLTRNTKLLRKYRLVGKMSVISPKMFSRSRLLRMTLNKRIRQVNESVRTNLREFFERDDVSRMCPGKKDFRTLKKVRKQTRILLEPMKDLYVKFCSSIPFKVSYSTFCRSRPFWVIPPRVKDRETCACKIHANIEYLVTALHKVRVIEKGNAKDMSAFVCCDANSVACLQRKCAGCKDSQIPYLEYNEDEPLTYEQWVTEKEDILVRNVKKTVTHTVKKEIKSTLVDLVTQFEKEFPIYMHHQGVVIHQFRAVDGLKKALRDTEAIIHCDFSENYAGKYSQEIQSYHFGGSRRQFTIHTVMVYYRKNCYSETSSKAICTLSECNEHSAVSAWTHLQPVFKFIREECPRVDTIHFVSDAPSTQYRNKTLFYLFTHALKHFFPFLKAATWNYSAPGHGKGAVDGLGGTLKRTADDMVAFGVDIANFNNFVATLNAKIRNIDLYVIEESEIEAIRSVLPQPADLPSFQGTMKVYQLIYSDKFPTELTMKSLSCLKCLDCDKFKMGCLSYPNSEEIVEAEGNQPAECLLEVQILPGHENTETEENQTSSENCFEEIQPQKAHGVIDDAVLKVETYLLVKFDSEEKKKGSRRNYRYVCCIRQIEPTLTVQGLRTFGGNNKFTLRANDICHITKDDVISILPKPRLEIIKRKEVFVFPYFIDVFEK